LFSAFEFFVETFLTSMRLGMIEESKMKMEIACSGAKFISVRRAGAYCPQFRTCPRG